MRSDENGHTVFGELIDQIPKCTTGSRVHTRCGFIEEEQPWFVNQSNAQRQSLSPAGREIPRQRMLMPGEPDQFQSLSDAGFIRDSINAAIKCQILKSCQIVIDRELLRHVPHPRADLFALANNVISQNRCFAFTWRKQT